ncbi:hypothetical protein PXH69_21425 [Rhodococcus qingshengii]|uniref:PE family protein n=1 Tax=Rhodococcus qingshengii TaxID=334542 RepID=A0AAW6LK26_RHOSG|nr:hypothetical protein [Rhodococcus qingshengii]MDE8647538.1 hypothetical protein [Rhodococcus qingshengii]
MTAVGMASVAGVQAGASAVSAIEGQVSGTHELVHAVAAAIVPPTQDSASYLASVRQGTNVEGFSAALRAGLAQQQGLAQVVGSAATTTAIQDELNAAAATAISV